MKQRWQTAGWLASVAIALVSQSTEAQVALTTDEVVVEFKIQPTGVVNRAKQHHQDQPEFPDQTESLQCELRHLWINDILRFPPARNDIFNNQPATIRAELLEKQTQYAGLTASLAQGNPILVLLSSPNSQQAYGTLIAQYQANEAAIARNSVLFKANHPTSAMLSERRENLHRTMLDEAQFVIADIATQIQKLEERLANAVSLNELRVQNDLDRPTPDIMQRAFLQTELLEARAQ